MRRLFKLAFAAAVAALAAVGLRRWLDPRGETAPASTRSEPAPPDPEDSGSPTREELYTEAQRLDIQGRSKMNKQELSEAVEAAKTGGAV